MLSYRGSFSSGKIKSIRPAGISPRVSFSARSPSAPFSSLSSSLSSSPPYVRSREGVYVRVIRLSPLSLSLSAVPSSHTPVPPVTADVALSLSLFVAGTHALTRTRTRCLTWKDKHSHAETWMCTRVKGGQQKFLRCFYFRKGYKQLSSRFYIFSRHHQRNSTLPLRERPQSMTHEGHPHSLQVGRRSDLIGIFCIC